MSEDLELGYEHHHDSDICEHMRRYLGETVTIFTESGGEGGQGFTGVLALVTHKFVRLIVRIGTPPDDPFMHQSFDWDDDEHEHEHHHRRMRDKCCFPPRRWCGLGSIVDIPCRKIVAFVHNAV